MRWFFIIIFTISFIPFSTNKSSICLVSITFEKLILTFLISSFSQKDFPSFLLFKTRFYFFFFSQQPFYFSSFWCFYTYWKLFFIQKNIPNVITFWSRILCNKIFFNNDFILVTDTVIFCLIEYIQVSPNHIMN